MIIHILTLTKEAIRYKYEFMHKNNQFINYLIL